MTENSQEKMNIVLCMNSKYVMPSLVCMTSILQNNKNPIDFYILYSHLENQEIELIKQTVEGYSKNNSLTPIKIDDNVFSDGPTFGRSREAYFRLLIPTVLPKNLERCLYVDSDVIIQKPLNNFYNEAFEEKAFVVCQDMGEFLLFHKERHEVLNIPREYRYFNSGVLLFNLNYSRNSFEVGVFSNYIKQNIKKLKFLDQDVLNALFYDKVKFVNSSQYNYMEILISHLLANDNMEKASIVHFIQKPWKYTYNGINAKYWWKYAKKIYPFEHFKFSVVNFIYRKFLGQLLLVISIQNLKKIKQIIKK